MSHFYIVLTQTAPHIELYVNATYIYIIIWDYLYYLTAMQARVPHQNPLYREEPLYRGERRSFLILDFAPELPSFQVWYSRLTVELTQYLYNNYVALIIHYN